MAVEQPAANVKLSAPDHSIMHRVLAVDLSASAEAVRVQADNRFEACFGKCGFTPEGGYFISLTNKTGANSVKGTVVDSSTGTDNAFDIEPADALTAIGVVYDDGIADGSECRVVIYGRCQVLIEDSTASTRGYWVKVSDSANGRADATNAAPPGGTIGALEDHLSELGHCSESVGSGTDVLVYIMLHLN